VALQGLVEPGHPAQVAIFEEGAHQIVLAREMPVEGRLGDAGLGNHAVDAGGAHAVAIEQVVSGEQDAPARGGIAGDRYGLVCGIHGRIVDKSVYRG
jgi:hypothetical protein